MALRPENEVAQRFARDLAARHGAELERIVLFGSVARQEHGPDSDIDLLVVVRGRRDQARIARFYDLVLDYEEREAADISLKVVGQPEVERYPFLAFWRTVNREGIVLWTRPPS